MYFHLIYSPIAIRVTVSFCWTFQNYCNNSKGRKHILNAVVGYISNGLVIDRITYLERSCL